MIMEFRRIHRTTSKRRRKAAEVFDSINDCRRAAGSSRSAAVIMKQRKEMAGCGSDPVLIYITEK